MQAPYPWPYGRLLAAGSGCIRVPSPPPRRVAADGARVLRRPPLALLESTQVRIRARRARSGGSPPSGPLGPSNMLAAKSTRLLEFPPPTAHAADCRVLPGRAVVLHGFAPGKPPSSAVAAAVRKRQGPYARLGEVPPFVEDLCKLNGKRAIVKRCGHCNGQPRPSRRDTARRQQRERDEGREARRV